MSYYIFILDSVWKLQTIILSTNANNCKYFIPYHVNHLELFSLSSKMMALYGK